MNVTNVVPIISFTDDFSSRKAILARLLEYFETTSDDEITDKIDASKIFTEVFDIISSNNDGAKKAVAVSFIVY